MSRIGKQYRHKKSGHIVTVMHIARLQTAWPSAYLGDMHVMVVYEHNGNLWVRSEAEFSDGRLEPVPLSNASDSERQAVLCEPVCVPAATPSPADPADRGGGK